MSKNILLLVIQSTWLSGKGDGEDGTRDFEEEDVDEEDELISTDAVFTFESFETASLVFALIIFSHLL